jgi:hypothetical protein
MRAIALIVCLCLFGQLNAIRFYIQQNSKRCLKEELHKDVVVTGDYEVTDPAGHRIDLHVTDSKSHTALMRESIDKGKIAVTADDDDIYDFCFISYIQPNAPATHREVHLELKHGVEAKNYDEVKAAIELHVITSQIDLLFLILRSFSNFAIFRLLTFKS